MLRINKGDTHIHKTYYVIPEHMLTPAPKKDKYDVSSFIIDAGLTLLTSGVWLIWVCIREMKK